jgi:glycosyltransferase involved in cell wall biosynthesis
MKKGILYRLIKKFELLMYRRASGIVILSENFRHYLKAQGIATDKIFTSISGVSKHFYARDKDQYLIRHYNLSNKFVVGCIGTFGLSHNHEDILSVATILKETRNTNIHFLMIGAGAKKLTLLKQKNKYALNNVTIDGPVSARVIPQYLSVIDLAIVPLAPTQTNTTVLPSKMLELMAMGIPIILYAPTGEAQRFLSQSNAGWFVNAGDINTLKETIITLSKDTNYLFDQKKNAIKFSKRFSRKQQAADLLKYMLSVYMHHTGQFVDEKI